MRYEKRKKKSTRTITYCLLSAATILKYYYNNITGTLPPRPSYAYTYTDKHNEGELYFFFSPRALCPSRTIYIQWTANTLAETEDRDKT